MATIESLKRFRYNFTFWSSTYKRVYTRDIGKIVSIHKPIKNNQSNCTNTFSWKNCSIQMEFQKSHNSFLVKIRLIYKGTTKYINQSCWFSKTKNWMLGYDGVQPSFINLSAGCLLLCICDISPHSIWIWRKSLR